MNNDLEVIRKAKAVALLAMQALRKEIGNTPSSTDRIPLRSELVEATIVEQDLEELEARLVAGATAMKHLTPEQVGELDQLARKLDAKIVHAKLLTLRLGVATTILESAVRVRDMVRGNIA